MGLAIPIETSARHIHMCRSDFEGLYSEQAPNLLTRQI